MTNPDTSREAVERAVEELIEYLDQEAEIEIESAGHMTELGKQLRRMETTARILDNNRRALLAERDALKAKLAVAIKHMTERFLNWPLPYNFSPDGGITFEPISNKGTPHEFKHQPSGTNLLDYSQAKAMVEHMLEGLNADTTPDPRIEGWNAAIEAAASEAYQRLYPKNPQDDWTEYAKHNAAAAIEVGATIRAIPCPYQPKEGGQ